MLRLLAVPVAFFVLALGGNPAVTRDAAAREAPKVVTELAQGRRFVYVHRRSHRRRTPTLLTTCYCYRLSYSAHVGGWFQVSRHRSWSRAVAARNAYSTRRSTCPACRRGRTNRRIQPHRRRGCVTRGNTRCCWLPNGRRTCYPVRVNTPRL